MIKYKGRYFIKIWINKKYNILSFKFSISKEGLYIRIFKLVIRMFGIKWKKKKTLIQEKNEKGI